MAVASVSSQAPEYALSVERLRAVEVSGDTDEPLELSFRSSMDPESFVCVTFRDFRPVDFYAGD